MSTDKRDTDEHR